MAKSNVSSSSFNNNNNKCNIYDIISHMDKEEDEPSHTKDVIKNIKKSNRRRIESDFMIRCKLFGCLMINFLLSAPIYSYGTIYLQQKEIFESQPALIWPPIIFNSVYLLVTPWLFNSISTPASRNSRKVPKASQGILASLTNKNIVIVFSLVLSLSISIAGFTFTYLEANQLIIHLFYSIIGGSSSCIIMGKLFVFMNGILSSEKLYLINFIYSIGQALSQTIFPFALQWLKRYICYNCALMIIGALMFHIIPITLMIFETKISIRLRTRTRRISNKVINDDEQHYRRNEEESRFTDEELSTMSFEFCNDIKYPSDVYDMENDWMNPNSTGNSYKIDNFLENLDNHRIINGDGVEILQTILEADEEVEIKHPELVSVKHDEEIRDDVIQSIYERIHRDGEQQHEDAMNKSSTKNWFKACCSTVGDVFDNISNTFHQQIFDPLQRSFKICKFYPSVILKACDIFSYLLFITLILPNLALKQFKFEDKGNVIYLIILMGFSWITYAVLVLRYQSFLKRNFMHYFHILGLLGKFFGYLFTNQRYSMNSFIFGIFLISLGHANSFHLQEIMIRNCFHPRKWFYVRGSIYSFSGFLILIFCIIFHYLYIFLKFVTFCNIFVLFNFFGILQWLLMHYKSIIYFCSQY